MRCVSPAGGRARNPHTPCPRPLPSRLPTHERVTGTPRSQEARVCREGPSRPSPVSEGPCKDPPAPPRAARGPSCGLHSGDSDPRPRRRREAETVKYTLASRRPRGGVDWLESRHHGWLPLIKPLRHGCRVAPPSRVTADRSETQRFRSRPISLSENSRRSRHGPRARKLHPHS